MLYTLNPFIIPARYEAMPFPFFPRVIQLMMMFFIRAWWRYAPYQFLQTMQNVIHGLSPILLQISIILELSCQQIDVFLSVNITYGLWW